MIDSSQSRFTNNYGFTTEVEYVSYIKLLQRYILSEQVPQFSKFLQNANRHFLLERALKEKHWLENHNDYFKRLLHNQSRTITH